MCHASEKMKVGGVSGQVVRRLGFLYPAPSAGIPTKDGLQLPLSVSTYQRTAISDAKVSTTLLICFSGSRPLIKM